MALRVFLLIAAASVAGAVLWLVMRWPPGNLGHIAGAAMILSGTVAAAAPLAREAGVTRVAIAGLATTVLAGAAEIAWLSSGRLGQYVYTENWQPAITLPNGLAFPVLLPVVWFAVLVTCYSYARQRLAARGAVIAGAVLATALDMIAEPLFTGPVGFWIWLEPTPLFGAPYLNALGWFLISLGGCVCIALATNGKRPTGSEPRWIILATLIGMAIVGPAHGEPRSLAGLLLLAPLATWRPRTSG